MVTPPSGGSSPAPQSSKGFSLVELMVSMVVLASLLVMFVGLLDQTQKSWDFAQGQISQFREARIAFDIMTKNLSQATLNAHYEQVDEDNNGIPDRYEIVSDLHFKIMEASELPITGHKPGHALFFQAPLGITGKAEYLSLSNLLNARGYYVVFNDDQNFRPPFINQLNPAPALRYRYRLMEFIPPTEQNDIYLDYVQEIPSAGEDLPDQYFQDWYENRENLSKYSRPLAENIVAIVFSPREPFEDNDRAIRDIAPRYEYDSEWPGTPENAPVTDPGKRFKHRLPPLVKVTLIAIDETTAIRMEDAEGSNSAYMRKFIDNRFQFADRQERDIEELIEAFNAENQADNGKTIRYKIFSTTVSILGAKWASTPENTVSP